LYQKQLFRHEALLPTLRKRAEDPLQDRRGVASNSLSCQLRSIALYQYLVNGNAGAFQSNLRECVGQRLQLLQRFDRGEPIDGSLVSMLASYGLFEALAASDLQLSIEYARHLGGRTEIEKQNDLPFVESLGYTLKYAVLDEKAEWSRWGRRLIDACQQIKENVNFLGHAQLIDAIRAGDLVKAEHAMEDVISGHLAECEQHLMFGELDKDLCLWGIGLANLCRWRGLRVRARSPLVPEGLLVA
jgi:hypothetical protein